jgi:hypothetical protein
MREKEKLHPDCQSWCPKPSISAKARPTAQHGDRQGHWGQARLVAADEAGRGKKGERGPQATDLMPESTGIEDYGS